MKKICVLMTAVLATGALTGLSQTVDIPDTYNSALSNTFDVADGSIISTNGVLVVFEGELSIDTNILASADDYDRVLATTQIYIEMTLFNELPDVNLFTNSQAAVLAVFDDGSTDAGTLYGLSDLGGDNVSWVQLTNNVTDIPMAVIAGATNLITVILRYPGTGYTDYEYTVSLSEYDSDLNESGAQATSQNLNSVTEPVTYEITGVSLMGEGAVTSMSSTSGDPEPLSARIDFSVYQSTNGVFLVDLYTVDENGEGDLKVYAYIDGQWVLIGSVAAVGSSSHNYQICATGLVLGESYLFKVVDEEGRTHLSYGEIEVKNIEMQAVQFKLNKFIIQFNSDESRKYKLVMSSDISAPLSAWVAETVEVNLGNDSWSDGYTEFPGAPGGVTQIRVAKNSNKAFFKILMVPDDDTTTSTGGNTP